jgi:hypothetical protein
MKKNFYLLLILIIPIIGHSQILFRSGKFLHHSTGGNIWGPNGSSTSIPLEIASYNAAHGYTGSNAVFMTEQWWPGAPLSNDNEWERWHRIFDNQDPDANIMPILAANKIVVVKSCYPSSAMTGMGSPLDTLYYTRKTMYNHKWHIRNIVSVMAQHPENFFALWTNAPLVAGATNPNAAALSKKFTTWMKDTLARGLDPQFGAFPSNVYVFHYFAKLTDANGYQLAQYSVSNTDSHPNAAATALVAPQFVNEIFSAAIAYEQGGPTLSVSPTSMNVSASAGSVNFAVSSNTIWSATSNQSWCSVTPSGFGNGNITATYSENVGETRTATITVDVSGVPSMIISLTQYGNATKVLNVGVLLEGFYTGGGIMNQSCGDNGPYYSPGITDMIVIELHNASNYSIIEYSAENVELSTSGLATVNIPSVMNDNYYITVKHRNSIETVSASPVSFTNQIINYSFNQPSKAYGNNLHQLFDGFFGVYSSDVDQDGMVDTSDSTPVDNMVTNYAIGYYPEDVNGDGIVDSADQTLLDNNLSGYVGSVLP